MPFKVYDPRLTDEKIKVHYHIITKGGLYQPAFNLEFFSSLR